MQRISFPTLLPQKINREELRRQFGSFTRLSIETEEQGYTVPSLGAESSLPAIQLLDVPRIITDIHIPSRPYIECYHKFNVSCLSDNQIWTSGDSNIMELQYNLQGHRVDSVQIKSGINPQDIAVTNSGNLVYTCEKDRSINLVNGTQIQTLFTLHGWMPVGLCSTSSGDILVIMNNDDHNSTKVVRYSGSTQKQTIQWDDRGKPLYSSSGNSNKYLSENKNLDICVADRQAHAVVVVSAAGKLRFRYTGPPSTPRAREFFEPVGITTDSRANILTSDTYNHRIHIIDQDGKFLRNIHNCGLQFPFGLCVDSWDNLFVAGRGGGVKKLQYYQ